MVFFIIIILFIFGLIFLISKKNQARREKYVINYVFPNSLNRKLKDKYPDLTEAQTALVIQALRDYFVICNQAKNRIVSMPSQVVDIAWHEFILFTRAYEIFCNKAIGRFLHHTPTEAMRTPTLAKEGIKRAWRLCCAKEKINPENPKRLPLLFAIDGQLQINDGFKYSLNCKDKSSRNSGSNYCAGHIGCSSGCAGDSGDPSDSDGLFGGSGDGGSDCGGGGCGGD